MVYLEDLLGLGAMNCFLGNPRCVFCLHGNFDGLGESQLCVLLLEECLQDSLIVD